MKSAFARALAERQPSMAGARRWGFVAYDQLSDAIGPLGREPASSLGIVLVENPQKARRRPYHKQKLALLLTNLRHFALEQAERGVAVKHLVVEGPYREALEPLAEELGPMRVMEPAERELRVDLAPLVKRGTLEVVPHEGWLSTPEDFEQSQQGPPWRMDLFYRHMRKATGILMERGKPVGGKLSFDTENRKRWSGSPPAPAFPTFEPDAITREIGELVAKHFSEHPGELHLDEIPATRADAQRLWRWALKQALPHFGPYEDAVSVHSRSLFHSRASALLNLHRLLPRQLLDDALAADIPLASKEGFVRQLLGWREYMRHVHRETDGFRTVAPQASHAGDGGWSRWTGRAWPQPKHDSPTGGATPSHLDAHEPIPPAFWGAPSGLHCLDHCVGDVWKSGYGHHITRLMVLSNIATLIGIEPRELADWFWVAYADAYDWVVEPNVLAMSTFGAGPIATTKPYVAGAAYIHRMSDLCEGCRFDPASTCPLTRLYWAFLDRNAKKLRGNPRLTMPLASSARRADAEKRRDRAVLAWVRKTLREGAPLTPDAAP